MALISCPECGKQISDRAKTCPHCGYSMEKPVIQLCPECSQEITKEDVVCPHCGYLIGKQQNSTASGIETEALKSTGKVERSHLGAGKKKAVVLGIIGILLVVAIIAIVLIVGKGKQPDDVPAVQPSLNSTIESETSSQPQSSEASSSEPIENSNADFRNVNWGMSRDEVKNAETADNMEEHNGKLYYTTTLINNKMGLVYNFNNDDQLYEAIYVLTEEHSNKLLYINDYELLQKNLIEKYGDPDEEKNIWLNDLYQDSPQDYGMAVAVGHHMRLSEWEVDNAKIQLSITGDNFEVQVVLRYTSKEIEAPSADKSGL